jgi:hypothetical protein
MGAANSTSKSYSGKDFLCCAELCKNEELKHDIDLSSDEKYKKWSESVDFSKNRPARSRRTILPQEKAQFLHHNVHPVIAGVENTQSEQLQKIKPPLITNSAKAAAQPPTPRRSSVSYAGNLPEGWTEEEQKRLAWAVAEAARRSRMRPPGHRAMQAVVAARTQGQREAPNAYGIRSLPAIRTFPHEEQCSSTGLGYLRNTQFEHASAQRRPDFPHSRVRGSRLAHRPGFRPDRSRADAKLARTDSGRAWRR